jgi:NAD(P)-dependent dehydrogenase (short-subunit alcohol dehydrogenase family)
MPVVVVGRSFNRAEVVAGEARALGVRALAVECDVSDPAAFQGLAVTVREEFGAVELLALNAGVTTAGPLVDHTLEDWDWVVGSGFYGVVHGIQYFLSDMIKAGHGHIVMTSSMVGLVPDYFLRHGPYTAVKAGLVGMAVGLLPELEGTGVGVSLLLPAGVDTGLADSHVDRPAVTAGVMTADEAPHPFQTVMPGVDAPALTRDLRFVTAEYTARRAFAGIQADELFIITHPEFKPAFEHYSARVLEAFDTSLSWEKENEPA